MKTEITIQLRIFPVTIRDERTGEVRKDTIALDKPRLQAAHLIGTDDKDLIYRLYNRQGYRVIDMEKPIKKEIVVDLLELYESSSPEGPALVHNELQDNST